MLNRTCSWCGGPLGEDPSLHLNQIITSHGICDKCSVLLDDKKLRLSEFISSFKEPILVMDAEIKAAFANESLLSLLAKSLDSVVGKLGGEVIECQYSYTPEKCGRSIHCSGCALRMAVVDTMKTGLPHNNLKSFHVIMNPDNTTKLLNLFFSTEKINNYVLVTIEKIIPEGEKK
jgi:hypothetical protein